VDRRAGLLSDHPDGPRPRDWIPRRHEGSLENSGSRPRCRLRAAQAVHPILWVALAATSRSGTLLLIGYPYKAFTNPLFYVKLSLIGFAIYLVVKIRNEVLRDTPSDKRPQDTAMWGRAKVLAGLCLACWMSVIAAGRFLAYTHTWLRVGMPAGF
jgi:hypothetical protein